MQQSDFAGQPALVWPPAPQYLDVPPVIDKPNTSGTDALPPAEVEKLGFHYGAFIGGPLWLMNYGVTAAYSITVLTVVAYFALHRSLLLEALPFVAWVLLSVWAGQNGYKIAWRRCRFDSIEQFLAVQRTETIRCVAGALAVAAGVAYAIELHFRL